MMKARSEPPRLENVPEGMSTDWSKYSTPDESRNRAGNPSDNGIVSFVVEKIWAIDLTVEHDPLYDPIIISLTGLMPMSSELEAKTLARQK